MTEDLTKPVSDAAGSTRIRPRWARIIHDFGDDLRWALGAWCGFPRPIRRATATVCTAVGGWVVGADELIATVVAGLTD